MMVYPYESTFRIKSIKNSVRLVIVIKTGWFREITALYFEKHVTHINKVYKKQSFQTLKQVVYRVDKTI